MTLSVLYFMLFLLYLFYKCLQKKCSSPATAVMRSLRPPAGKIKSCQINRPCLLNVKIKSLYSCVNNVNITVNVWSVLQSQLSQSVVSQPLLVALLLTWLGFTERLPVCVRYLHVGFCRLPSGWSRVFIFSNLTVHDCWFSHWESRCKKLNWRVLRWHTLVWLEGRGLK